jgi:hypothetical protein
MQLIRCISVVGSYLCCLSLILVPNSTHEIALTNQVSLRNSSRKLLLEMPTRMGLQQFELAKRGVPKRREGGGTRLSFPVQICFT